MKEKNDSQKKLIKYWLGILSGPLCFILILLLPFEGMDRSALLALGTFAWTIGWIMGGVVPWFVSCLIPAILLPLFNIMKLGDVASTVYGNSIFFLVVAVFLLGRAIDKHGLGKRLALIILSSKWIDGRISRFLLIFMIFGAFSAPLMMSGTLFIMFSIGLSTRTYIVEECREKGIAINERNLKNSIGLAMLYSVTCGSMLSIPGIAQNSVNIGLLEQLNGLTVNYLQWFISSMFVVIPLLIVFYIIIRMMNKVGVDKVFTDPDFFSKQKEELGKMGRDEWAVLIIFVLLIAMWIIPCFVKIPFMNIYWVAILGVILCYLVPSKKEKGALLDEKDLKTLDWNIIMLVNVGLGMSTVLTNTGVIDYIAQGLTGISGAGILAIGSIGCAVITNLMSGLAADITILNVILPIVETTWVHPVALIKIVAGTSIGFLFPWAGSIPALAFAASNMEIKDMAKTGIVATIALIVIIVAGNLLLTQFFHFYSAV